MNGAVVYFEKEAEIDSDSGYKNGEIFKVFSLYSIEQIGENVK